MYEKKLKELENRNLIRDILSRSSAQGPYITIKGKRYINFSSNDYLGLAGHPEIRKAAVRALRKYGVGSGASRLIAGGSELHAELENRISRFKKTESALLFNSGYSANTGTIPALVSPDSVIFSDELNHASIIDGCRLSRAKIIVYRHRDTAHLEKLIKKASSRHKLIVTDSVFSMDGDIAPLGDLFGIARRYGAQLYIDDAHGTGVLGNGRGAMAHFKLRPEPWIIQMGTFSKAFGAYGAFVAGSANTVRWISNTARSFIFSTALPACLISASIASLEVMKKNPGIVKKLWSNREMLLRGLQETGFNTMQSETPVIPVRTGSLKETMRLSGLLFRKSIYAPAIRPPAVQEPRIRFTVSAAHTKRQINKLVNTLTGISDL